MIMIMLIILIMTTIIRTLQKSYEHDKEKIKENRTKEDNHKKTQNIKINSKADNNNINDTTIRIIRQ